MAGACGGGGDALVRYVAGAGFRADGYFCVFDGVSSCHTNVVLYDGAGLRPLVESVPLGDQCTGGTLVDYDGTGLKAVSHASTACLP